MRTRVRGYGAVLPAYAGMIPGYVLRTVGIGSAPRVCGDDPDPDAYLMRVRGCSPRMRG